MVALLKAVVASCTTAAFAVTVTACGGSTPSTMSSASSAASSAVSSATSTAAAEGTLASVCTEIDGVMLGQPDADPAGTSQQLEAIKAKVTTGDAELIGNLAVAYAAIAANPGDTDAQSQLSSSAEALGAGCEMATTAPRPN